MSAPEIQLSVVIATHNRRQMLRRCLDALAAQDQDPADFEVLVADDGSSDDTAEMLAGLRTPFPLRVLRLDKGGKSAALNAAIAAEPAPICLFIDDDIVASPRLVSAHLAAHREDPAVLGIGPLTQPPARGRDWLPQAHAVAWNQRYEELEGKDLDWPECYGGNFSAPLNSLREVGGFATDIPAIEDIELGYRLVAAGCVPRYLPEAAAVHEDEKQRAKLLADVERYGAFCAEFAEPRPDARPKLLGWFLEPTPRDVTLRRALLALKVPPAMLASLGTLIPGAGRKQVWFGFLNRYLFWRGARAGMSRERWRQTTRGVPVLMYHAFGAGEEDDRYVISRRRFARQLRLLRALRYRVLGFEELARMLGEGEPPPPRSVVVTIDDGYADNLEIAKPLLTRYRIPATIFLVSRRLGGVNDWTKRGADAHRPLLRSDQVQPLAGDGIAIGAHTRTHPVLPELDAGDLATEIEGSREDLEALLGEPVRTFAYPFGKFSRAAIAAAGAAGYDAACTVESRPARLGDDPLEIPRLEIRGSDTLRTFLRKLWFGGA
ncbi:MAG TPA: glycosyltransferase [Solirubrobacterales bacterium]|jgi:peptidoglycan/xylan/chitin deacetylase (PgdA/CDA1 family)/GT2 family glycosyltransferase|nr:glycosyltransferase [Solirubrobacterales bacterium]